MKKIILLLFIIVTFLFKSNSQTKDFTAEIDYVDCDAVMADFFTNFSCDMYCWDFGDGRKYCVSYTNEAWNNYYVPGKYTVTFKGVINGDTITITKKDLIIVYNAPKVSFDVFPNDSSVFAPFTAKFINKTIPGDGDSLKYNWKIRDSIFSNDTNPVITFNKPGTYGVLLEVTDNKGCNKGITQMLIVKDTAQKGEINYIISKCSKDGKISCSYSGIHFQICRDTLRVYGITYRNCCTNKTVTIRKTIDTIFIREWETGAGCTCGCEFCFAINVPGITEDSVYVSFADSVYLTKKSCVFVGIKSIVSENIMNIYPNPAENNFIISFSEPTDKFSQVEINDLLGNTIYKSHQKFRDKLVFNGINFKAGIYFVRLIVDKGKMYTAKLIIK